MYLIRLCQKICDINFLSTHAVLFQHENCMQNKQSVYAYPSSPNCLLMSSSLGLSASSALTFIRYMEDKLNGTSCSTQLLFPRKAYQHLLLSLVKLLSSCLSLFFKCLDNLLCGYIERDTMCVTVSNHTTTYFILPPNLMRQTTNITKLQQQKLYSNRET